MNLSRRGFLGGIIASATMAEAGMLSELMDWLRRKPVSVIAPITGWPVSDADMVARATRMFISRGDRWEEIFGVQSVELLYYCPDDVIDFDRPVLNYGDIEVQGKGFLNPCLLPDPAEIGHFRVVAPDGSEIKGVLGMTETSSEFGEKPRYSLKGHLLDPAIYEFAPPGR